MFKSLNKAILTSVCFNLGGYDKGFPKLNIVTDERSSEIRTSKKPGLLLFKLFKHL